VYVCVRLGNQITRGTWSSELILVTVKVKVCLMTCKTCSWRTERFQGNHKHPNQKNNILDMTLTICVYVPIINVISNQS